MSTPNTRTESLAGQWQYTAGQRYARANQLGNCTAGLVQATEAGILRQCARELEAAPLAARAPEVGQLLARLGREEWGSQELGTLMEWFRGHGYVIEDVDA